MSSPQPLKSFMERALPRTRQDHLPPSITEKQRLELAQLGFQAPQPIIREWYQRTEATVLIREHWEWRGPLNPNGEWERLQTEKELTKVWAEDLTVPTLEVPTGPTTEPKVLRRHRVTLAQWPGLPGTKESFQRKATVDIIHKEKGIRHLSMAPEQWDNPKWAFVTKDPLRASRKPPREPSSPPQRDQGHPSEREAATMTFRGPRRASKGPKTSRKRSLRQMLFR